MNNWKINKTVDLARGIDGVEVWPHALLVAGDENAHEWNVTVMDNGKSASLSGNVQAYFVRSDGATVIAAGSIAGNVATVTLPKACYAYEGDLQAVMQLLDGDVSVTLSALLLRVRQISTDVIVDPGSEIPSLDDLLAQIENMKQATNNANAATNNANQAATAAETRVDEAISDAEGRVNTAVQSAETATSKANASAAAADASKEAADTATQAANDAADRANKAASGVGIRKKIVDVLPAKAEMEQDVLYLVRRAEPNAENVYDEYMLINGEVEAIGSTRVDLTGYAKKDELAKVATSGSYADLSGTEGVATKEYVGEQIDAIEIGGRNLALNTNNPIRSGEVSQPTSWPGYYSYAADKETLRSLFGKTITISFDYDVRVDSGNFDFSINNVYQTVQGFNQNFQGQGHIAKTINVNTYSGELHDTSITYIQLNNFVGNFVISNLKIERGNKPTDWSPAPEDVNAKIDGIEIGGRNRFVGTRNFSGERWKNINLWTLEPETHDGLSVYSKSTAWEGIGQSVASEIEKEYTFSAYVKADADALASIYIDGGNPNSLNFTATQEWQRVSLTTVAFMTDLSARIESHDSNTKLYVCGFKLEFGNKATDWSPAPEDVDAKIDAIEIGGRNLLLNSNVPIQETSSYFMGSYLLSKDIPVEGGIYTVSIKGKLGDDRDTFMLANTNGNVPLWNAYIHMKQSKNDKSIYFLTFVWTNMSIDPESSVQDPIQILIYNYPQTGKSLSSIEWIKLERGNKPTDWSPAPEDTHNLISESEYLNRNILLNSGVPVSNGKYLIATYYFAKDQNPIDGEIFTIEIKANLGEGISGFYLFNSSDAVPLFDNSNPLTSKNSKGIYAKTFKWVTGNSSNSYINIFVQSNSIGDPNITSTIEWVRLHRGSMVTNTWSPAPEDMQPAIFDTDGNVQLSAENLQKLAEALKGYLQQIY